MARTILRRLVSIPAVFILFGLSWVGAPVFAAIAVIVDIARWLTARRPWMAVRLVGFLMAYTFAEVVGLLALSGVWLASVGGRLFDLTRATFAIQRWWAGFVLGACRAIFGLRISGAGLDTVHPPPFILVARHTSIIDNLLPAFFISRPHGTHIRYVMKHELLADPALDVAGSRLVNVFVRRSVGESDSEVASIRQLAETLPADEVILIYPEGTRFTEAKRDRSAAILARRSPRLARLAAQFTHVLPPRPGGVLALVEACEADVVVMAHRGLDGFARVADIWRGAMVRTHVEVQFWRVPRCEIPTGRAERAEWLFDLWGRIDRWVGDPA
ncbi:MAG: 1-acyl-sn-glycerol-3-phosphate acyltransferase [Acidimicrobiia bacterium]